MGLSGVASDRWWRDILAGIKAPDNTTNRSNLNAWLHCEGGTAQYNPFNTTLDWPGATLFNSSGVKNYPSLLAGESATIDTLLGSNMAPIVRALRNTYDRNAFADAVGISHWGTNPACIKTASGGGTGGGNPGPGPGQPTGGTPPPKAKVVDTWSPRIDRSAAQLHNVARIMQSHSFGIKYLIK